MALGVTMMLPTGDKVDITREQAEAKITVAMGGRVADERFLKIRTAGASNDIEQATELARRMVCEWGMSDLGPVSFGKREEQIFLGREIAQHRDYSEATAIRIDEQVKQFVQGGYERATKIIEQYSDAVDRIALALLEREVLDGNEVTQLIEGRTLAKVVPPPTGDGTRPQQVITPERTDRTPNVLEGGPQPA
jgi:cell division protease FtsH